LRLLHVRVLGFGVGSLDLFSGDGSSLGNAIVFQPALLQTAQSVDVADLNNDGKLDLLIQGTTPPPPFLVTVTEPSSLPRAS
jgi:hypothetical protein